jgi:hypothetical protein
MIVPLAYKYVAVTLMLAEINFCASRLHLPVDLPIKEQDVKAAVFPPSRAISFAGRIDTKDYSFTFAKSGRLRFITKLEDGYQSMGMHRENENENENGSVLSIDTKWIWCIFRSQYGTEITSGI